MYPLGKSVAVTLHDHDKPYAGAVGVSPDRTIFGLVSRYGDGLSFMSYRLDAHFVPEKVIARERATDNTFYFDYGNKLTITADELERAFRELGLL